MSPSYTHLAASPQITESLRLEAVTVCVGFDDLLDVTLGLNHPHLDTLIVVTSHADRATQAVARKHGAICAQTDLFGKNGRPFNKGAAINAGFSRFQYHGWRLHLDADIALPDNFRRILFNHTAPGPRLHLRRGSRGRNWRQGHRTGELPPAALPRFSNRSTALAPALGAVRRYLAGICSNRLFPALALLDAKGLPVVARNRGARRCHVCRAMAGALQPRHLPTVICQHLCAHAPSLGENWDGERRQPRIS